MIRGLFFCLFFLAMPSYGEKITFNILHLNDVYEFFPVGAQGGLSRVATIQKRLLEENPRTITIIAGDFLSPSPMSAVKVNGEFLAGRHMVDLFNTMNLDFTTFGNHEFDLQEKELLARINESKFRWFTSNVFDSKSHKRWKKVEDEITYEIVGQSKKISVGLFGVTLDKTKKPYVSYTNFIEASRESVNKLKRNHEVIIALTHLDVADDVTLADKVPGIDLILGGHDHENLYLKRGAHFTTIAKADGNAKSVYVHELTYDTENKHLEIQSKLVLVTDEILPDPKVDERVSYWKKIASDYFKKEHDFDLNEKLAISKVELDARREAIRVSSNPFTKFVSGCVAHEGGAVDGVMYSVGMIRIDDKINKNSMISNYDLLRMMPYPEDVVVVKMSGALLIRALDQGVLNKGGSGFLHLSKLEKHSEGHWLIKGDPIKPESSYHIAVNTFLISGREVNFPFLTIENNPDLVLVKKKRSFLKAIAACIKYETHHDGKNFGPLS